MNLEKPDKLIFYNIDEQFYFVDLPGYGYSKMSKQEQVKVNGFIDEYLHVRKNISLIVLLIDIRHKPGANDRLMYDYIIRSELPFIVIANKADKIAITKVDDAVNEIQKDLNPIGDFTFLPFLVKERYMRKKFGMFYQIIFLNRKIYYLSYLLTF